jgi:signal transduction histidine kinase
MPYIFNRFFRGDKSRTQAGIGLGLSMVKAFTKVLQGDVMVSSALGKGSTFTVSLPI